MSRLENLSHNATVTYHSDKPTGRTAGSETVDVAELLHRMFEVEPLERPRRGQQMRIVTFRNRDSMNG